jgi:hypothetical protein
MKMKLKKEMIKDLKEEALDFNISAKFYDICIYVKTEKFITYVCAKRISDGVTFYKESPQELELEFVRDYMCDFFAKVKKEIIKHII